jgi:hypothetical protein
VAEPLQREQGGSPRGGLVDCGAQHGTAERVGENLEPRGRAAHGAAGDDDLAHAGQVVGDLGEAEGDALEGRVEEIGRRRLVGEAGDGAARAGIPPRAALASEERQHDEAVVAGLAAAERLVGPAPHAERAAQPVVQVAGVRQRTAQHEAGGIDTEQEERGARVDGYVDHRAQRPRRADGEAGTLGRRRAHAEVRARAVAEPGEPGRSGPERIVGDRR